METPEREHYSHQIPPPSVRWRRHEPCGWIPAPGLLRRWLFTSVLSGADPWSDADCGRSPFHFHGWRSTDAPTRRHETDAGPHLEWVRRYRGGVVVRDHEWEAKTQQLSPRASEPSPAPEPRPASRTGPTGPILRANPYPEVTDLICRLPLPTLVYRPEASYLGDRLRIWVRTGPKLGYMAREGPTARAGQHGVETHSRVSPCSYLPRMFHGPAVVRGTPQEPRRSTADRVTNTLSLCEWLLGSRRLKQKRKLFPGPPPMDASWFPLPGSCTRRQTCKELVPGLASRPGYGISTVFPFATNSRAT